MSYVKFAVMMACSSCSEVVPRGSKNPPKKRLSFYIARQVLQSRLVVLLWWCGFQWQKLSSLFSFWWWPKRPPSKKKRLNKALEAYQAAYAKHKIKRKNEAAWLDGNAEWKQRPGKTKLNENRLRLYALQLDAPRWANHEPQWIKVFQFLPAQHSAKTRRTDFCWHQHSSKWVAWLPTVVSALLLLSKKRLFIPSLQLITTHLSESVKNASPPWLWAITTDPLWSESTTSKKKKNITKPNELIWYYLQDSPKCGFVGEEILVVPVYTKLLPISEYLPQLPLPRLLFLYVVYQWLCVNSVLQNPKLSPSLSCS